MPLCRDSAQGPKLRTHMAQEAKPKAIITLGLPHHQYVYSRELGGWGAGRREWNGKTRERKKDKGTAQSQQGKEGIGSHPGSGTVPHESQALSAHQGWGENDHPLPVITASGILSTRNWLTATGC